MDCFALFFQKPRRRRVDWVRGSVRLDYLMSSRIKITLAEKDDLKGLRFLELKEKRCKLNRQEHEA